MINRRGPKEYPPGTRFNSLVIIREVERAPDGHNRRFLCRCTDCGREEVKFLSNLMQGKRCLCTVDFSARTKPGREKVLAARAAEAQVTAGGRMCLTCQTWKPWEAFYDDPRSVRGKASNCIECARWASVRLIYGLTKAEWTWLYDTQGGVCAICGEPEMVKQNLSVDHDHSCCGKKKGCKSCIRGLLCSICNRVLGLAEAAPELAIRFADYLNRRPFILLTTGDAQPDLEHRVGWDTP
jgi:Recombination endonuclease VII